MKQKFDLHNTVPMKIFRVGGSVRDALLGLPVNDIDYVVTGSSPEDMVAAGFIPVGKDFPVFIHPKTHAEYALARTERKSAPGYRGFVFHCAPDVTIEEGCGAADLSSCDELRKCTFILDGSNQAVLFERNGSIRGYYDLRKRDEVDRLRVELKILLKKY